MQKTLDTLTHISQKYRGKSLGDPNFALKLAEDLVKTIGVDKLDAVAVIKNLIQNQHRRTNLGDTNMASKFVEDVLYTFDDGGAQVKGDLVIPNGLHEIEQPLTREQVAEMYAVSNKSEVEEEKVVSKPKKSKKQLNKKTKVGVDKFVKRS